MVRRAAKQDTGMRAGGRTLVLRLLQVWQAISTAFLLAGSLVRLAGSGPPESTGLGGAGLSSRAWLRDSGVGGGPAGRSGAIEAGGLFFLR